MTSSGSWSAMVGCEVALPSHESVGWAPGIFVPFRTLLLCGRESGTSCQGVDVLND